MGETRREFLKKAGVFALASSPVVGALGSVASSAARADTCTPPPTDPHGPSKLGFHCLDSSLAGHIEYMASRGAYFSTVKGCSDFSICAIAKRWSPRTITVGRYASPVANFDDNGDPLAEARAKMKYLMDVHWSKNRNAVDYWEVLNEPDPVGINGHRRLGEFFMKCMEIAELNGYKLALFSYAAGVPEWEEFEALVKLGVFEMAKAGGHILALHEYCWICQHWGGDLNPSDQTEYGFHPGQPDRGQLGGRYRWWYKDFLEPSNQVIPLIFTEAAYDDLLGVHPPGFNWRDNLFDASAGLQNFDNLMRTDDYVLGAQLFTVGEWGDHTYYESQIVQVRDYVISLAGA